MEILNETTNTNGTKTYEVRGQIDEIISHFKTIHNSIEVISIEGNDFVVKELSGDDL